MGNPLPTLGSIAARYGVAVHRVMYVIRSRGIQPIGRAGNSWVYSEAAAQLIGHELTRIARERGSGRNTALAMA